MEYANLNDFLQKHKAADASMPPTHTRIGSKTHNVFGGSYYIPPEKLAVFRKLYFEHVFVHGNAEHLTEKQLSENGPILVDFDFRYPLSVNKRQHDESHIQDMVQLFISEIACMLVLDATVTFPIYVLHKPNVVQDTGKNMTKDGIHFLIGLQMDHVLQEILRERMLDEITSVIELPITNTWDAVYDIGVVKGSANWTVYGSRKPGCDAYKVTHAFTAYCSENNDWVFKQMPMPSAMNMQTLCMLSAQCDTHLRCPMTLCVEDRYLQMKQRVSSKRGGGGSGKKRARIASENGDEEDREGDGDGEGDGEGDRDGDEPRFVSISNRINIHGVNSHETLAIAVKQMLDSFTMSQRSIRDLHKCVQILPEKYYEPGSHLLNTSVAFALKHTDERLFWSWIMLRAKASDFDFDDIPHQYHRWKHDFNKNDTKEDKVANCVTKGSILFWAKQDAYDEYMAIRQHTLDTYVNTSIIDNTDWDFAMVLYQLFKEKFVCSDVDRKVWYIYNKHRWEKSNDVELRSAISTTMLELYNKKQDEIMKQSAEITTEDPRYEMHKKKLKRVSEIICSLKKTANKNNIMREARDIFYDANFSCNLDANPYLLCFTNGVFDFRTKTFRDGKTEDYVSKTTGIPYIHEEEQSQAIVDEIHQYMNTVFPKPNVCRYMWDHLASTLIGVKKEHVFNIYRGSGANGKSVLVDLMTMCLGEYKGVVPITLVTEKRSMIGQATPEIISLKGVRFAVMQEPSKNVKLNEGIMKELTGGDIMQGRALFSASETFKPQFSLAVCTNHLFDVDTNDDGTWRRMKVVDFVSKFLSPGEQHTDDTPYVFVKNKDLPSRMPAWATVFMSMLVKRACETMGEVIDCEEVIMSSNNYRKSQDAISEFISDKIEHVANPHGVGKAPLQHMFKDWYMINYTSRKMPKMTELVEAINKKFGQPNGKTKKWTTFRLKEDEDEHDDDDNDNEMNVSMSQQTPMRLP